MITVGAASVNIDHGRATAVAISHSLPLVTKVTRRILNRAKVLAPVRTGRLRSSGKMQVKVTHYGPTGTVTFPVRYAGYVHDGTRPHVIRARRGKALKFTVSTGVIYRPLVHHPGTRARPFVRRAMLEVAPVDGFVVTV